MTAAKNNNNNKNKGRINFITGIIDESEESRAYREVVDYLIRAGNYPDKGTADNDAIERVRFCEEMDLYAHDARLRNASLQQRKLHALMHGNNLQQVISANGGFLPQIDDNSAARAPRQTTVLELPATAIIDAGSSDQYHDAADKPSTEPSTAAPLAATAKVKKDNVRLAFAGYFSRALLLVVVLLTGFVYLFDNEQLSTVTKYSFLLFSALLVISVAVAEAGSRLMRRIRYASIYLFFLSSLGLSASLLLQQSWPRPVFDFHGGAVAVLVNLIGNRLIPTGPFWPGIFFAGITVLLFIAGWFAKTSVSSYSSESS